MIVADDRAVKLRGERLNEIWWQGRQWAVTSHGIEARDGTYTIAKDRLREEHAREHPYSWIAHLSEKSWIDLDDFATAYFVAVAMHAASGSLARNLRCYRSICGKGERKSTSTRSLIKPAKS